MQGCANILERILYPHDTWDINSITFSRRFAYLNEKPYNVMDMRK